MALLFPRPAGKRNHRRSKAPTSGWSGQQPAADRFAPAQQRPPAAAAAALSAAGWLHMWSLQLVKRPKESGLPQNYLLPCSTRTRPASRKASVRQLPTAGLDGTGARSQPTWSSHHDALDGHIRLWLKQPAGEAVAKVRGMTLSPCMVPLGTKPAPSQPAVGQRAPSLPTSRLGSVHHHPASLRTWWRAAPQSRLAHGPCRKHGKSGRPWPRRLRRTGGPTAGSEGVAGGGSGVCEGRQAPNSPCNREGGPFMHGAVPTDAARCCPRRCMHAGCSPAPALTPLHAGRAR